MDITILKTSAEYYINSKRVAAVTYKEDDIIVINPYESTDFEVLQDTTTVVVKHPGANDDKYLGDPND